MQGNDAKILKFLLDTYNEKDSKDLTLIISSIAKNLVAQRDILQSLQGRNWITYEENNLNGVIVFKGRITHGGHVEYMNANPLENPEIMVTKLKWLGKPEQFGFIFSELARNGYIEIPGTYGDGSYSKYAKICFELFEFKNKTTLDNLKRALNPEKNKLSEGNKVKLTLPHIDDIS